MGDRGVIKKIIILSLLIFSCNLFADNSQPIPFEPEDIGSKYLDTFTRAKVIGGWIVSVQVVNGAGITFVPDPNHEWKIK
jgi:hypothetical protein